MRSQTHRFANLYWLMKIMFNRYELFVVLRIMPISYLYSFAPKSGEKYLTVSQYQK
jgi:hypothetical protein